MHLDILIGTAYILLTIFVCLRILYDIQSTTKTFAYLLVVVFMPVIGMIIYFAVGANYRKNKLYSKKIVNDHNLLAEIREKIVHESEKSLDTGEHEVKSHKKLARMLMNDNSPLTGNNEVKLLLNGENKFPEVLQALKDAKKDLVAFAGDELQLRMVGLNERVRARFETSGWNLMDSFDEFDDTQAKAEGIDWVFGSMQSAIWAGRVPKDF